MINIILKRAVLTHLGSVPDNFFWAPCILTYIRLFITYSKMISNYNSYSRLELQSWGLFWKLRVIDSEQVISRQCLSIWLLKAWKTNLKYMEFKLSYELDYGRLLDLNRNFAKLALYMTTYSSYVFVDIFDDISPCLLKFSVNLVTLSLYHYNQYLLYYTYYY